MKDVVRLRLTPLTAVRLVAAAVLVLAVLVGVDRSRHLIAWLLTAAALALVLDGPVRLLSRLVPRGWALALVILGTLVAVAGVGWAVADSLIAQYARLQDATPGAAQRLAEQFGLGAEDSDRFVQRVGEIVDEGPRRLLGSPRAVTEGTLSRLGIAAIVLTLAVFLLAAEMRMLRRAAGLLAHVPTGARDLEIATGLLHGAKAARRRLGHVVVLGLVVAAIGASVGLPGAQPLGLWVALWRLLPMLGILVAYVPVVTLLLLSVGQGEALAAVAVVVVVEAVLSVVVRRRGTGEYVPLRSLTAVLLLAGFEMYGAVGAVVVFVLGHTVAGAVQQLPNARAAGDAQAEVATEQ